MGSGSSKQLISQNSKGFVDKSRTSKELADRILNIFFSKADFRDILSLSSITQCPRYVFTTADALQSLFQTIQIYPNYGKQGEILFAPISKISPGILKDKTEGTQELLEKTKLRNQMCMDVAYFYVRIFQIYGALALTILDTDPTRRFRSANPQGPPRQGSFFSSQSTAKPGFQSAPLFGGALPKSGPNQQIRKQMDKTAFAPLTEYLTVVTTTDVKSFNDSFYLKMDDKNSVNGIFIEWVSSKASTSRYESGLTLDGIYRKRGKNIKFSITMIPTSSTPYPEITLRIDGKDVQQFKKEIADWEFIYDDNNEVNEDPTNPKLFYEKIHELFENAGEKEDKSVRSVQRSVVSGTNGVSITSGKTSFEGFDQLKKIYEDRYTGKEFPKAYCVARAMTLMTPIFESERLDKRQPYYSQVCKRTYDFETNGEIMPRAGKQPKANIYLRSLVSLYYDDYQVRGGEVVFTQTESGRSQLRKVSAQFAALYNITTNPETFLESNTPFKPFAICNGKDVLLEYREPALKTKMLQEIIIPMLQFQETHTVKVNELFKKMFDVTVDKQGRPSMAFNKILREGGRQSVNEFGRQAHELLLQYYSKSEAYFIRGVLMLEKNSNGILAI